VKKSSKATAPAPAPAGHGLSESQLEALLGCRLEDPHHILGLHSDERGPLLRVFDPHATAVAAEFGHGPEELSKVHPDGLFILSRPVEKAKEIAYELISSYGETSVRRADPYSFAPTLSSFDLHLINTADHRRLYDVLGARLHEVKGVKGVRCVLWAPNAARVSVIGNFNSWDGRRHMMRKLMGSLGLWEIFIPGLGAGEYYKFEIRTAAGQVIHKQDPLALACELRPGTSGIISDLSKIRWNDDEWMTARASAEPLKSPVSIYEVHLGSWGGPGVSSRQGEFPNYRELGRALARYCRDQGFTHVELLPITEHPFDLSWGYQTTGYFAPTSRFGTPEDFAWFVDHLHQNGIGVILDWVPAHFPTDEFALGKFDGSSLYEHDNPEEGYHPDWNTYIFNYGRAEVANFLLASALFWLKEYHIDGLRVDAVASMLYRDYSRENGAWRPNIHGGRENYEAIAFMRRLNEVCHGEAPGCMVIAEESTAFAKVSRPVYDGGLGYTLKWNMGWMHDTLKYFGIDPVFRKYHQNQVTFSLVYAFHENFCLPLSHDEVVHGKGSLIGRMPGDTWQKFANLRCLYAYMFAHPGKKLLFMGAEIAQWHEWNSHASLDWATLRNEMHAGIHKLTAALNALYKAEPALYTQDFGPEGFAWIDCADWEKSIISFQRIAADGTPLVCICNLTPEPRRNYRLGLPAAGSWKVLLDTDEARFGGSGHCAQQKSVQAVATPEHGLPASGVMDLPPLSVLWLKRG
jgi:1,4-alpha-glucan branching enzyme